MGAQPKLVGGDLRERGLQALADRGRAREHGDAPGVRHPHDARLERAAAGALDAMRKPDADVAPLAARGCLPRREVAPLRRLEHHRLAGRIVAAVVLHGGARARFERLGVGHLLGRDQVAPPQLGAVELQLARHTVHHPLHCEGGLRIAGAADRGDRRLVGGGDRHVHRQRRHDVGAAHHGSRIVGNVDVLQRISADVVDQRAAQPQHLAVGRDRDIDRPVLVALLRRIGEVLAPVLDPLDRAPKELGRGHDRDVLRIDAELGTEAATDIGRLDPQPRLLEIKERRERLEQIVRLLGRGPDCDRIVGVQLGQNAAALDRMPGAAVLPEIFLKDMRGLLEGGRRITEIDLVDGDDIGLELAPHRRRVRRDRLAAVGNRRQRVIVDLDQCRRVLGDVAALGDHDGDGFTHVGDFAVGERERPHVVERSP